MTITYLSVMSNSWLTLLGSACYYWDFLVVSHSFTNLKYAWMQPVAPEKKENGCLFKVTLYFFLSGVKLCALKKSVSCALPMYPCKWPNSNSLCVYPAVCDIISSPMLPYIESCRPIYRYDDDLRCVSESVLVHIHTPPCIFTPPSSLCVFYVS